MRFADVSHNKLIGDIIAGRRVDEWLELPPHSKRILVRVCMFVGSFSHHPKTCMFKQIGDSTWGLGISVC